MMASDQCVFSPCAVACLRGAAIGLVTGGLVAGAAAAQVKPFPEVVDLSQLRPENGGDASMGVVFAGTSGGGLLGNDVAAAGDVNGDGFDDLVIGAYGQVSPTTAYVILGGPHPPAALTRPGDAGPTILSFDRWRGVGHSVSGDGDIDNDGLHDVLLGDFFGSDTVLLSVASSTLIQPGGPCATVDLVGFPVITEPVNQFVSIVGDVNGDGIDDLGFGRSMPNDRVEVLFGTDGPFLPTRALGADCVVPQSISLDAAVVSNGLSIELFSDLEPPDPSTIDATQATRVGDINGDGIDDIGVAFRDGVNCSVVYGQNGFPSADFGLQDLASGGGISIDGLAGNRTRTFFTGNGDFNADGADDLLYSFEGFDAPGAPNAGVTYLIFGSTEGLPFRIELANLGPDEAIRFVGAGADDHSGVSVGFVGDINNDGFDDIAIGTAPGTHAQPGPGETFVIYGTDRQLASPISLADLDGELGFTLRTGQNDGLGFSVARAGDLNTDGIDDLVVGAPFAELAPPADRSGAAYVLFGVAGGCSVVDTALPAGVLDAFDRATFDHALSAGDEPADLWPIGADSLDSAGDGDGEFTGFDVVAFEVFTLEGCP